MKLAEMTYYKLKMMLGDRLFFAAMIVIPLFIIFATGHALRYEKLNTIPIAVADEDQTQYSEVLQERLAQKEGLSIKVVSRSAALNMVKNSKVEAAFIIKKGFGESLENGESRELIELLKSPSSFSSSYASEVVAGEVMRFRANSMALQWISKQYGKTGMAVNDKLKAEINKYIDSHWESGDLMNVNYQELDRDKIITVDRISLPAATATSAGVITMFIMFYILFSSSWLIEERRNGTLKRLVCGPDALGYSFAANIASLLLSGAAQVSLFYLVIKVVFKVELLPGFWALAVIGAYLLAVISISMFLSSILRTPAQMQAGAPPFALLTGFMGGCFWNFVDVPDSVKRLSFLTPQGWVLDAVNKLLIGYNSAGTVILPLCVLLSISLVLLPVSYCLVSYSVRN